MGPRTLTYPPRQSECRLAGRPAPDCPTEKVRRPKIIDADKRKRRNDVRRLLRIRKFQKLLEENDGNINPQLVKLWHHVATPQVVALSRVTGSASGICSGGILPSNSIGLPEEPEKINRPFDEPQLGIRVSPPAVIEEEIRPSSPPPEQPVVMGIVDPWRDYRGKKNRRKRRKTFVRKINFAEAEIVAGGSPKSDESGIDEVPAFNDFLIDGPINSDDELVLHDEGVDLEDADF
ncbi:uncharacterized protein LOC103575063 isoform X2 [Microplitis demolitor]|nr:uncharacterized protein LOC103575063 isoform X2 [Microplitis demolitor]